MGKLIFENSGQQISFSELDIDKEMEIEMSEQYVSWLDVNQIQSLIKHLQHLVDKNSTLVE